MAKYATSFYREYWKVDTGHVPIFGITGNRRCGVQQIYRLEKTGKRDEYRGRGETNMEKS